MALRLIRAGKYGEHEQRFFADSACYLTWEGTKERDLHQAKDYEGIKALLADLYPDEKPKTRVDWASQIARFVSDIQPGDWVVMPHKHEPAIAFGEVTKGYAFDAKAGQTGRGLPPRRGRSPRHTRFRRYNSPSRVPGKNGSDRRRAAAPLSLA